MRKFKKIGILFLVIVIIASFIIVPMLKKNSDNIIDLSKESDLPAIFTFDQNLKGKANETISIEFEILEEGVTKVNLVFNDSIFETWTNPTGKIVFDLNLSLFGVGVKELKLISRNKNHEQYYDMRLIQVLSDISPEQLTANVVSSYLHNPTSFTQGLEFNNGILYESMGEYGKSKIAQVDLKTGTILKEIGLDGNYFGEGITIMDDKIYQITWREQKCFVYDKNTLQIINDIPYNGEGWGLTNDGKSIIMSDGTERIVFRNPNDFKIERVIEVYDEIGPRKLINELEYIDGKIYANLWMLDLVLIIDPNSGKVLAEIDASEVAKVGRGTGEVMNGIAFNKKDDKLYFTGKNWNRIVEVSTSKK
jgi:glutaminyl-peptide cyclotransferase